jgi:Lon protease-like protein
MAQPGFLPIFPLALVAYPGEQINLHIFEPRYKALIRDVLEGEGTFGLPPFLDDRVGDWGTEMRILSVEKTYEDGKMDIRTEGVGVFRILELLRDVPNKPYSGAVVDRIVSDNTTEVKEASALFAYWRQLQDLLNIERPRYERPSEIRSFELAHFVGLSVKQEYELLSYARESDRQQYLIAHLKKVLPVIKETERARMKAQLNGQFQQLDAPDF